MTDFDYDAELSRYHQRLWSAARIGPEDRVLDIGCGTGLLTREAAAVCDSAVGVDISDIMLAVARELGRDRGNVSFEHGNVQVHPFPAEHFTLAVSRFGTMFFADPHKAFANIARAFRPGARFVQLVWQDRVHQGWDTVIRDALGDGRRGDAGGEAFSLADPAAAERLLAAAGFDQFEVTDVREPVYYGPDADADAAVDAALALRGTQDLLADHGPAETENALQRLRIAFAARHTVDGIWLDTRAWIITARRR